MKLIEIGNKKKAVDMYAQKQFESTQRSVPMSQTSRYTPSQLDFNER